MGQVPGLGDPAAVLVGSGDDEHVSRRAVIASAVVAAFAAGGGRLAAGVTQGAGVGAPTSPVGERSPYVKPDRSASGTERGSSLTPLQDLKGTITPADLHFEVHHAGVPAIDPSKHTLLVHGLVDRPMMFTVADLERLPSVTRVHFIECSGNGEMAWRPNAFGVPRPDLTPQKVAGLAANSEWTGVPVRVLLDLVGAKRNATWCLAEGSDACLFARSIPTSKLLDDALIVFAQNGEPLRPENGYPVRLLLPGWEGSANVKWLRRLELGARPWMTRWETSTYTDPLPDSTARQFSFEMDARSIITSPAHPQTLTRGWNPITGLAWSGRGKITRVEVSVDRGATWTDARLSEPVLSKAFTRFTHAWEWTGNESVLMSRATDETGYVQPTRTKLIEVRGIGTAYHWNPIYGWKVAANGRVFFHGAT